MLTLRALAQAYITLEDYERYSYIIRTEEKGIDLDRIYNLDKMSNIMSNIRKDISSMQTDLDITRKVRKGDKESNLINELEDFKKKRQMNFIEKECSMFGALNVKLFYLQVGFYIQKNLEIELDLCVTEN